MIDCNELPGKLRDICNGTALKGGVPFSPLERAAIVGKRLRQTVHPEQLPVSPLPEHVQTCDGIGDWLKKIIRDETGSDVVCGDCKREIEALNSETTEQVQQRREQLAKQITLRAAKVAARWWERLAAKFAPNLVRAEILKWIDEACRLYDLHRPVFWEYGITTVPWRKTEFQRTIESLKAAGFDSPRIFVDALPEDWYSQFGKPVSFRGDNIKTASHWILSMQELFYRNPNADRYAIFQDDVITSRNLRAFLDLQTYPESGYWNLFSFYENEPIIKSMPGTGWTLANQKGQGALALVFDRQTVVQLLSSPHLLKRTWEHKRHRCIDGGIVTAMIKIGISEYVHNPTLVQHIGHQSSMGNKPHPPAASFRGEAFNLLELLNE